MLDLARDELECNGAHRKGEWWDVHPLRGNTDRIPHELDDLFMAAQEPEHESVHQAVVEVGTPGDIADGGDVAKGQVFEQSLPHRPCTGRYGYRKDLTNEHIGPEIVAPQGGIPFAGVRNVLPQRGDGPGLQQIQFAIGYAPFDVLGASQVAFKAAAELVEPAGESPEFRRSLVVALGTIYGERIGFSLTGNQFVAQPVYEIADHLCAASTDRVGREQHARYVRPHELLNDDSYFVGGADALGLAVGLYSLVVP